MSRDRVEPKKTNVNSGEEKRKRSVSSADYRHDHRGSSLDRSLIGRNLASQDANGILIQILTRVNATPGGRVHRP